VREVRERSDEGRVDVCRRLRVLVVVPLVGEPVLLVGPADDRADVDVGVGPAGVERGEPLRAPDPARVRGNGRQRGRAVVDAARVLGPVPDHVRHPHRVAAQEVVHLPPRDPAQPLRRDDDAATGDRGLGDGEVLGVGEQQEGAGGDVLHVAVAELVQQAAPGVLRLVRGRAGHHGADEPVRVALVLAHRAQPLHQERLGDEDPRARVLVVPPERVVRLVRAQHLPVRLDVPQVRPALGRAVEPRSSPKKLVLVPRVGAVEWAHVRREPAAVGAPVLVCELKHLYTTQQEQRRTPTLVQQST
jgi:hypothetical protein